jgi:hypothetical protein
MAVPSAYRRRRLSPGVPGGYQYAATLTTEFEAEDSNLTFTARERGAAGNDITVAFVVDGADTELSVVVDDMDIVINVATDSESAATSTAAEVAEAVEAETGIVTIALEDEGAGVVEALAETNLSGGTDWVVGQ